MGPRRFNLMERWGSFLTTASENEPTNPKLWAKVQALAKGEQASITVGGKKVNGPNDGKGFTVFPSAYANGWASKVYKDLGGGWKKKAGYDMPRKFDREHCESKTCDEMGFSEKASCRPYKNCYRGASLTEAWGPTLREASGANGFMSDYRSMTFDNFLDPRSRVWSYATSTGERLPLIMTEIEPTPHGHAPIWFKSIASPERQGTGQASAILRKVSDLADKHGVALWGTPKPFGNIENALSASKLKGWYKRYGWEPAGGDVWIRRPAGVSRTARGKAKKDVGHGGLDEWFSGHGGAKGEGEDATWGDWVSISPVKKTLDSGKKVEPGDIVGPCGISDDPDWKDLTKDGKDPLKCMPREKAYDMGKKERAERAKEKQKAEKADSNRGKKPTHTPTFKKDKKKKKKARGPSGGCNPRSHSHSWIHPDGKVEDLRGRNHDSWAIAHVRGDPKERARYDWWAASNRITASLEYEYLLEQGWVRVANYLNFGIGKNPSKKALRSAAEIVVQCAEGSGFDPQAVVTIDQDTPESSKTFRYTVDELVEKWGGRSLQDEMFRTLLSKMASRVAAAQYTNKRKVPRRDGNGETTIYEYSEAHVKGRNKAKADRVEKLRGQIADLRKQVKKDLADEDPKKRLTALAVSLIDETFERVGNEGSAKEGHFGVTTLLKKHLSFEGGKARLRYVGKSGVSHDKTISNKKVVSMLKDLAASKKGADLLFCEGADCVVRARDVNAYLRPYEVTAKDLRGLHANEQMKKALTKERKAGGPLPSDKAEREKVLKAEFKRALEKASASVGHQASTLKSQYLVPGMEDAYLKDGTVLQSLNKKATLSESEREDRETEKQVRTSPKAKPPRRDLEKRRIQVDREDDPDEKQDKKDRSNNYKDAHQRLSEGWGAFLIEARGPAPLEPGEVRKTDKGRYTGMNPDGATHTYDDEEQAKAFAEGRDAEESGESEPGDLEGKRESLMKKYREMGLLGDDVLKDLDEAAEGVESEGDLKALEDLAKEEVDKAKAERAEAESRAKAEEAEKAKEKQVKDVSGLFKGGWSAESNISSALEELDEEGFKAFSEAFSSRINEMLQKPPKPAEIPNIVEDAKKMKDLADRESQVKSLAKDPAKLAEALALVKYHEEVLDNPLVDSERPLPDVDDDLDLDSRVDRSKRAMEKYLEMDAEDRKRHFDRLQNEAEKAKGARKEAIEAIMQGIGIASVIKEGSDAKGVAGATSRLIQAAHKTGKIDKILEMPRKSDTPEQRAQDQKLIREVYEDLREEEWLDVVPEGHPGRGLAELLSDPMGKGRFLSWDDKADIRARLADMLVAETAFLDPALQEVMGADATTAEYDEEAKAHRATAAGGDISLKEDDDVAEVIGSWTDNFLSGLASLVAQIKGESGSQSEERKPGEVWGEPGAYYAKDRKGEQGGPYDDRVSAEAWASGKPQKKAVWVGDPWPRNIFQ